MKKVIVQDMDCGLLETLTIILEDASYHVLAVRQYKDVLSNLGKFNPDLVLLDFKLAGMESAGICGQLKKQSPSLPVIALSCNMNIQNEYMMAGFDDYISKPFDIDHFFMIMKKYTADYSVT